VDFLLSIDCDSQGTYCLAANVAYAKCLGVAIAASVPICTTVQYLMDILCAVAFHYALPQEEVAQAMIFETCLNRKECSMLFHCIYLYL
jgi:hypothetical protein